MKFLIDAQLPRRLAGWLFAQGHDALHTLDLPSGNRTQDTEIIQFAQQDDRSSSPRMTISYSLFG